MPPSFSEAQYWDKRFTENTNAFDWLLPEQCFDEEIADFLKAQGSEHGFQILHIGSGTSMLSFHLAGTVPKGSLVHNVDFSKEAVEWGRLKEHELAKASNNDGGHATTAQMSWNQVALLSLPSLLKSTGPQTMDLIIDKSTSDAIACGADVLVDLSEGAMNLESNTSRLAMKVHPLHILALNLAVTAKPGARWLCLSYSKERLPWVPTLFAPHHDPLPEGMPNPAKYWSLVRKKEIQTEEEVQDKYKKIVGDVVHRMATSHYLYVLERTERKLDVDHVLALKANQDGR